MSWAPASKSLPTTVTSVPPAVVPLEGATEVTVGLRTCCASTSGVHTVSLEADDVQFDDWSTEAGGVRTHPFAWRGGAASHNL